MILYSYIIYQIGEHILKYQNKSERIRYLGITTSHGHRHEEIINFMQTEPIDFVQFTYNITHRSWKILLPLAAEKGIAVIINRHFHWQENLFNRVKKINRYQNGQRNLNVINWAQ